MKTADPPLRRLTIKTLNPSCKRSDPPGGTRIILKMPDASRDCPVPLQGAPCFFGLKRETH